MYDGVEYSPGETWTDGCARCECFESGGFGCVCRRDADLLKRGDSLLPPAYVVRGKVMF